jgi:hypothetical protein
MDGLLAGESQRNLHHSKPGHLLLTPLLAAG